MTATFIRQSNICDFIARIVIKKGESTLADSFFFSDKFRECLLPTKSMCFRLDETNSYEWSSTSHTKKTVQFRPETITSFVKPDHAHDNTRDQFHRLPDIKRTTEPLQVQLMKHDACVSVYFKLSCCLSVLPLTKSFIYFIAQRLVQSMLRWQFATAKSTRFFISPRIGFISFRIFNDPYVNCCYCWCCCCCCYMRCKLSLSSTTIKRFA